MEYVTLALTEPLMERVTLALTQPIVASSPAASAATFLNVYSRRYGFLNVYCQRGLAGTVK
jgi:hypothetical protein